MIKLVVTDLDGTLLDSEKRINPDFWDLHKRMVDKGILFSIASGRQLYNLEETFAPIAQNTLFIADNGTYVRYQGQDLHISPLDQADANKFIQIARKIPCTDLVLCCKNAAYLESKNNTFIKEIQKYYSRVVLVDDLTIVDDTILKLSIYDSIDSETNSFPHFRNYTSQYNIVISGKDWIDISHISANKGVALQIIQKKLGLDREEIMAFGDFLNDYEMMEVAGHSYAMKNAHPEILRISRFVTEFDNNNNGVIDTIRKVCFS